MGSDFSDFDAGCHDPVPLRGLSRFESLEKLWRRRDERTSFGPSRRDSNPCFSLERASPWAVISPTSTPGATARCHSRRGIVPHFLISPVITSRAITIARFVRSAAAIRRAAEGPVSQFVGGSTDDLKL